MADYPTDRFALVVASQSATEQQLVPLEAIAEQLREILLAPHCGECAPASGSGLLLNPSSVCEVETAVREAVQRAADRRGTLLLAFLGHGSAPNGQDFLFKLPNTPVLPNPATAYALPVHVQRELADEEAAGLAGLTVLVDTCASGFAALNAARDWFPLSMSTASEVEVLAAADERIAYDLSFTRALTTLLANGHARLGRTLGPDELRWAVGSRLKAQLPQVTRYDGRPPQPRRTSRVSWNVAHNPRHSLVAASKGTVLLERLAHFQLTNRISEVARAVVDHRVAVLEDAKGRGKTTLLASLTRPELLAADTPSPRMCALVQVREGMDYERLMAEMRTHLTDFLTGFAAATHAFEQAVPEPERTELPPAQRYITGPLGFMPATKPVRVAVDGLDQLDAPARPAVITELERLLDSAPPWFGAVIATRVGLTLPASWHREPLPPVSDEQIARLLDEHQVRAEQRALLIQQAAGNWHMADLLVRQGPSSEDRPTYDQLYDHALAKARRNAPHGRTHWVDALVTVLIAAGDGAELPWLLFIEASRRLDGPQERSDIETVFEELPGLIGRRTDPVAGELLGVDHRSWADHVRESAGGLDIRAGHRALAEAIDVMAPMDEHSADDPLHGYATTAEPMHLWRIGDYDRMLESITHRRSTDAAANRDSWLAWCDRLAQTPGPLDRRTLRARQQAAYWAGRAGSYPRSREMYGDVLRDQLRTAPPDDPDVLETRHRIAYATGQLAEFAEAVELHRAVYADQLRAYGPDDRRTLATRHHLAYWTGRGGRPDEALAMHKAVLADQLRVLDPTDRDVLESRHYIAYWYGRAGRLQEALAMHERLLTDRTAVFGAVSEQAMFSRMNICLFTGESGDPRRAVQLCEELLSMVERLKGPDHPDFLLIRLYRARFIWESGRPAESLALHQELLGDLRRVHRPDFPRLSICRYNIAMLQAELGESTPALIELTALNDERMARHGRRDHADVLITRYGLAVVGARTATDPAAFAERTAELRVVLTDRARMLGPEHTDTLFTCSTLAELLARTGAPDRLAEAETLLRATVTQQTALLGARHPRTMMTRYRIADVLTRNARTTEAAAVLTELLPQQRQVLGAEHPETMRTARSLEELDRCGTTGYSRQES
jgi:tetratricopeptide (TPR) repeat protein